MAGGLCNYVYGVIASRNSWRFVTPEGISYKGEAIFNRGTRKASTIKDSSNHLTNTYQLIIWKIKISLAYTKPDSRLGTPCKCISLLNLAASFTLLPSALVKIVLFAKPCSCVQRRRSFGECVKYLSSALFATYQHSSRFGRRPTFFLSVLGAAIFGSAAAASPSPTCYNVLRFFAAVCVAGIQTASVTLRKYL